MIEKENITKNIKLDKNIEILKKNFPSCFDKNGNFNIEKFKEEINENKINLSKESYGLEWLGKSYARAVTFESSRTLLKEDEEWNKKEENENSKNLLIKGNNLEVLKHLSHSYYEKIKMIYIDPPYNTGNGDFVYQDDRKFTIKEFTELAGVNEEKAKRILDFVNSKSNSHSAWLTFMYPRLYIARKLLKDDGVIFISIDDNEVAQLRLLMDEVFGEENFVGEFVVNSTPNARDYGHIGKMHEYVLFYTKNYDIAKTFLIPEEDKTFKYNDERGGFNIHPLYNSNVAFTKVNRPNLYYSFYLYLDEKEGDFYKIGLEKRENSIEIFPPKSKKDNVQFVWRWGKKKSQENLNSEIIGYKTGDGKYRIVQKMRHSEKLIRSLLLEKEFTSRRGTAELERLFQNKIFNFPKPVNLIKRFLQISTKNNDIILDFFAGSGTTGDAVMQLNAEDRGERKYILVQLPELIDEKKNKVAYEFVKNELNEETPTIFDITKERLIRAGKKIIENGEFKTQNFDRGFKIFENIPLWEDYLVDEEELSNQTNLFEVSKLSKEDLKALFITWKNYDGLTLTEKYQEIKLNDYTTYYCGNNLYFMNDNFDTKYIKTLFEKIDNDKDFVIDRIIIFGYNFDSINLREIEENICNYANKKQIEIETIIRF